ncbi:hypothetical protein SAMN04489716_6993 [Actinoplanes derwentensis]|uniref:Uncharacterized protein n=2 Tax=Actinoplanes derwentensis TaxID=113562 RepID=A0A1H2CVS2_9ACTN|nr:hypothetical protein Ade03nite_09740 [Actinoplanes derwentensis]SDT74474.1 hypothetical protein SAMN04489716_6993 [Actinoplanes derwentensis]
MGLRDYPPAAQIHRPDCPGISQGTLPELTTAEIARSHPNAVMHNCYHFHQNTAGVVEPVVYPPHDYKPSTNKPADARRPLCATCRGTHGDQQVEGAGLLLPTRGQRILLPGESSGGIPGGGLILPGNR